MSFQNLIHSFTSCHRSSHSWLGKIICFGAPPEYNHSGWWRRSGARTMCTSIGMWALANIDYGRMGREWLITILRLRDQHSTGKMSSRLVLVAVLPQSTDLLTRAWHRRVAFLSFILHIEVSTVDFPRSLCLGGTPLSPIDSIYIVEGEWVSSF